MDSIFNNKVAIVTGGSFGIGRATAIAFAQRGAKVVVVDNAQDYETIQYIRELGSEAMFIKCDVSSMTQVRNMVKQSMDRFGRLDYAFNNAGIEGEFAKTHECTEENFDKTIAVNLKAVWLCMRLEIPEMLKREHGVIINCASIAGFSGFAGSPAYVASKHAVIGLTKTAALEYSKQGIRINAICPGVIHTPMVDRVISKDKTAEKRFIEMEPIGRMGRPSEVAETVMWLCSDAASFVTGIALPVDGGFSAA